MSEQAPAAEKPGRREWRASLLVLVLWAAVTMALNLLQTGGRRTALITLITRGVSWGVLGGAAAVVAAIVALGWWRQVGVRRPVNSELLLPVAVALAAFAAAVSSAGLPSSRTVAIVAVNALLVA